MTPTQKLAYDYIKQYQIDNQRPPTYKEIADNSAPKPMTISWAQSILGYLIRDGYITMDKGKPRSIFITEKEVQIDAA